jgi:hypothetical protein
MTETRIDLENGKYTVIHENGSNLRALRYGEEWRSLTGDGLVLAMAHQITEALVDSGLYFVLVTTAFLGTVIVLHDHFDKGKVINATVDNRELLVTIAEELLKDGSIVDYRIVKEA